MKKSKSDKTAVRVVIIGILALALVYVMLSKFYVPQIMEEIPENGQPEIIHAFHVHADFAVFVNGQQINFSDNRYDAADPRIHIHVRNFAGGSVLHVHSEAGSLGLFFVSVGMHLNSTCFSYDGYDYCSNVTHSMKFFVNGLPRSEFGDYVPNDLDRILVSYGNEDDLTAQMGSVTNYACVFSNECAPPKEAENRILYN